MHPIREAFWGEVDPYKPVAGYEGPELDLQGFDLCNDRIRREIERRNPQTILEIGAFKGASAIWMAQCAPDAHVLTIDPWRLPVYYFDSRTRLERFAFSKEYFLKCVKSRGLQDRITYLPMLSNEARALIAQKTPELRFDFAYIDGDHEYRACFQDLESYAPLVDGPVVVDDYMDDWPDVMKAVEDFVGAYPQWEIDAEGRKAILSRQIQ